MPAMMSQVPQQGHMQMGQNPVMQQQNSAMQQQNPSMMGAAPYQNNKPIMQPGPIQQMHGASPASNQLNVLKARVLFSFAGDGPNQMKLTAGDIVDVLSRGAPGGWCRGTSGAFPTDYVDVLSGAGMQINQSFPTAPLAVASNISLNSAPLGSTTNITSELRQLPVSSFGGGQSNNFSQSKNNDDSGKMRIDLKAAGSGRYGGQSMGTSTTSAPTTPLGSLLDMDLDSGVIHKSNSMSQSKVEELDIFGIDNSSFSAVPSTTSLLDLDAPVDLLTANRPDPRNKSILDLPMPVMNASKGNNKGLAFEGLMSSGSLLPVRSPSNDTFQKTTSSTMMYNSSNLNMSSFDRLDIFSDSSSSTIMATSSTSAVMNGFQSQDVMDLRSLSSASGVSGSGIASHSDGNGMKKTDVKPPPVTARVVPPTLYARAIYSREGDGPTELSLECGDFILVDTKEGEWWSGSKVASLGAGENTKGKIGYFPGNYVELVEGDAVSAALHSTPPSSVHGFSDDSNPFGALMQMTSVARKVALRGTNAAQAIFLPDTDDLSGVARSAPIAKLSSTFVCSLSLGENIPIWRHPAFADFYVDFHVPHPPAAVVESKNIVITYNAVKKMSVALRFVCMALQRAREVFINAKNRISSAEEVKNEFLSQVLMHSISVFNEGSKLCDKLPAGTG